MIELHLDSAQLGKLEASDKKSLADHIALVISSVGENLNLKRATCVGVGNHLKLAAYAHPSPSTDEKVLLGKFGTVLVYSAQVAEPNTHLVARQLCQHIVGMNPMKIGKIKLEEKVENKPEEIVEKKVEETPFEEEVEDSLQYIKKPKKEEDTSLMQQEFLMDPEISVGQLVTDAGINVIDFVRFECGESSNTETTPEVELRAQQVG